MNRLASMLVAPEGSASVDLGGRLDPLGRAWLEGSVDTTVRLVCQRCLESMEWHLSARVAFRLSDTPLDDDSTPPGFDSLVVEEGERIGLDGLVEDELILAMPIVARHDDLECGPLATADRAREEADQTIHRPFADLAEMLAREREQTKE